MGAADVRCAVLYAHSWSADVPDYVGLVSDALLMNPWDREVYQDGAFRLHPEYADALGQQGITPAPDLLIDAPAFELARQP